jgi:hypothetical protein
MHDFCFTPFYSLALVVGGFTAYLTKGSTASLGAWAWLLALAWLRAREMHGCWH